MILKSPAEITVMRQGGAILADILKKLAEAVKPGITTLELDLKARELFRSYGVRPSFLGYDGFPAAICVSINEEIVHGLPSKRIIQEGDVVSIDAGVFYKKFHTDSAVTVLASAGNPNREKQRLIEVAEEALKRGIKKAEAGNTLGDIGQAIQKYVESEGFSVVRDLVGHGIGRKLHESPEVLNYGPAGKGERLEPGLVIAIEPMVSAGSYKIADGPDGYAYITADGSLVAHAEHTVAITKKGPVILTQWQI